MTATAPRVDQRRRSVAGNTGFLFVSQGLTWLLAFVMTIALPRHLGPEVLGQLRLGISLWTVAGGLIVFGTHTLLTKEFSRHREGAESLLGGAVMLQLLVYAASWFGMAAFVALAGYGREAVVVVAIIGVSTAFTPVAGSARAVLYGLERMEFVAYADVITKALHVGSVLALIGAGADVRLIAAANTLYTAASAVLLVRSLRRFQVPWRPRLAGVREVARQGRGYLMSDLTLIVYQQIDVVVISLLVSSAALGWYATADGLMASLLFVPNILMTTLFPVFSRLHASDSEELLGLLHRYFGVLITIAVPVGLGTMAVAGPVAIRLFGQEFAETGPVLAVMGPVLSLVYLTILLGRYAIAIDRLGFWLRIMMAAIVATIGLDLVLVPYTHQAFGNAAIGGALAYLVTESAMLAIGLVKLAPSLLSRAMLTRVTKTAIAGAAMVAAVWPLRWLWLPVPIALGAVTYVGMVLLLKTLDDEEKRLLRGAARSLISKATGSLRPARATGDSHEE